MKYRCEFSREKLKCFFFIHRCSQQKVWKSNRRSLIISNWNIDVSFHEKNYYYYYFFLVHSLMLLSAKSVCPKYLATKHMIKFKWEIDFSTSAAELFFSDNEASIIALLCLLHTITNDLRQLWSSGCNGFSTMLNKP